MSSITDGKSGELCEKNSSFLLKLPSLSNVPSLNMSSTGSSSSANSSLRSFNISKKEIRYISYNLCLTIVYKDKAIEKFEYKRHCKDSDKKTVLNSAKNAAKRMIQKIQNL